MIALSGKELILTKGIHAITVAEVAKNAGIGKGTVYEYFSNKNEIVFALIAILMREHFALLQNKIEKAHTTKEKIRIFSSFFYDDAQKELREIYKQFIVVNLSENNPEMKQFHQESLDAYYTWFERIICDGIDRGELIPDAKKLIGGIFATGKGLFIQYSISGTLHKLQEDLDRFIDAIFALMEKKQ